MQRLYQDPASQLADRWTVLINEINRYRPGQYPDLLCIEVFRLIGETERLVIPDPFEQDLILTARTLAECGEPKIAMFKLHEVIRARM